MEENTPSNTSVWLKYVITSGLQSVFCWRQMSLSPFYQKKKTKQRELRHWFLEKNRNRWLKSYLFPVPCPLRCVALGNLSVGNSRHTSPPPKPGKRTPVLNRIKRIPRVSRVSLTANSAGRDPGRVEGRGKEHRRKKREGTEGRGKVLPWFWPSWATWVFLSRLACRDHCVSGHTGPCLSEQVESDRCFWFLRYLFCFTKRGDACRFSDPLRCCPCRVFGFVARKQGSATDNVCHLFAEHDPEQPASAIVNFVSKVMIGSQKKIWCLSILDSELFADFAEGKHCERERAYSAATPEPCRSQEGKQRMSICILFARVQPFLWRCLWLNKALFCFYIKGQNKRSWVPPKPM